MKTELRKKQLEKLLRRLRQLESCEKQQAVLIRVKNRLFSEAVSSVGKESWARVMWR